MICKMCATGADMIQRAKELAETKLVAQEISILSTYGPRMHLFCSGRTHCDCQHKESLSG